MVDVEFEWIDGAPDAFVDELEAFADVLNDEIEDAAERIIEDVHDDVEALAPVDTGELRDSYRTEVESVTEAIIEARVISDVEHAPYQEFMDIGTPHVAPALQSNMETFENEAERAWNNAVRRVS